MIDQNTLVMGAVLAASFMAFIIGRMSRDIFPFNQPETKPTKRKKQTGRSKSPSRSRSVK